MIHFLQSVLGVRTIRGFIYIMSNPAFKDGLVKIGISKSDPSGQRQDELFSTGVPEPFKMEYFAFVEDYEKVERIVHSRLHDKRNRSDREFFDCTVPEAIIAIRENSKRDFEEVYYKSPEEIKREEERQREKRLYEEKIKFIIERKEREKREQEEKERKEQEKIQEKEREKERIKEQEKQKILDKKIKDEEFKKKERDGCLLSLIPFAPLPAHLFGLIDLNNENTMALSGLWFILACIIPFRHYLK